MLKREIPALLVCLLVALLLAGCAGSDSTPVVATPATLKLEPCYLPTGARAECGTYSVYEDRQARTGRKIDLRVAVIRAKNANPTPDPMFYLAGGPGDSAFMRWGLGIAAFDRLHEQRDWVLVEQRGTGSTKLTYPPLPPELVKALYLATPEKPGEAATLLQQWSAEALKTLDGDLRFYTTSIAMDDLDEIRAALGYSRINLYGISYGATAAQFYLRQHGDHVRTVILDGGSLLDVPIFERIAPNGQQALDLIFSRCEKDSGCNAKYPGVREEFNTLLNQLTKTPAVIPGLTNPFTGQPLEITADYIAGLVRGNTLSAENAAQLPRQIQSLYTSRDFTELGKQYYEGLNQGVSLESRQVMSWTIKCNESWARFSPAEVEKAATGSYLLALELGAARQQELVCAALPKTDPNDGGLSRVRSGAPVLLLNGEADPQDPPANVANAEKELTDSLRVTVPGQGHGVIQFEGMDKLAATFVNQGTTRGLDISFVKDILIPPFDLRDQG